MLFVLWEFMHIKTLWFGVFILAKGKVVKYKLFPKNPEAIAHRLLEIQEGRLLKEERKMVQDVPELTTSDERIARLGIPYAEEPCTIRAEKYGFNRNFQREVALALAKIKLRETPKDMAISQRIKAIDMLTRVENLLFETLRDWYAYHFPELEGMVASSQFLPLILEYGERDKILSAINKKIDSLGTSFSEADIADIRALANTIVYIQKTRGAVIENLSKLMESYAPNLKNTAGAIVGAKLIEKAGSLKELALLPSSTIQILGAEKAFFRHLRKRGKMPKHGIIFQHPTIMYARKDVRGKLARTLASKIAIAARKDAFNESKMKEEVDSI